MRTNSALRAIGEFCAGQGGLVTAAQARGVGLEAAARKRMLREGVLEALGGGVYLATAYPAASHLDVRAAWLRLDPRAAPGGRDGLGPDDAVVSHRSACLLLDLGDIPAPEVELSVPRRRRTSVAYVRLRVRTDLTADQVTVVGGLPVTTPARTILDLLRDGADGGHIGGVVADAAHRGLIDLGRLAARVESFAPRYALTGATGLDLLTTLMAMSTPT